MSVEKSKKYIDDLNLVLAEIIESEEPGFGELPWGLKVDVWSLPGGPPDPNLAAAAKFNDTLTLVNNSLYETFAMINVGLQSGYNDSSYYKNVLAPQVEILLRDIRSAQDPGGGANFWKAVETDPESPPKLLQEYFEPHPKREWFDALENLVTNTPDDDGNPISPAIAFLDNLGIQINILGDIRSTPSSFAPGTSIIKSDINLELSLLEKGISVGEYYIGINMHPRFSKVHGEDASSPGVRFKSYIPVRLSPYEQKTGGLPDGWDDPKYQLIDNKGKMIPVQVPKTDYSSGIEFPLGTTVFVTEFVSSATGMWVGFIPIFANQGTEDEEDEDIGKIVNKATKNYERILYTRPEYLRKKESSVNTSPDPLIKLNLATNKHAEKFGPSHLQKSAYSKKGVGFKKLFSGGHLSYDWASMRPMDVQLAYFNFNEYNKEESLKISEKPLSLRPGGDIGAVSISSLKLSHKFSEGYYYFIVGEETRESPERFEGSSEEITDVSTSIINKTFDDLLRYLGKDPSNTNTTPTNLVSSLKRQYFAPVSRRAQTSGVDSGKLQVLFAIPAAYIDSLPDSKKPYFDNFSPNSEFAGGNNYSFNFYIHEYKEQIDKLVKAFESYKEKVTSFIDDRGEIRDVYDLPYDIGQQIKALKNFPAKFDGFLQRQWTPYTTEQDVLNGIISAATIDEDLAHEKHIVQIGLRDNGQVGENVRFTISYVLFSPDPASLKNVIDDDASLNLFDFDPYYGEGNAEGSTMILSDARKMSRSAVVLRKGLDYFRNEVGDISVSVSESEDNEQSLLKTSSVLGTRTLHYLMSCGTGFIKALDRVDAGDEPNPYILELARYSVPPISVKLSARKDFTEEDIKCTELLKRINEMPTQLSTGDRKIQEQFYNSPECMKLYFKQFSKPTPAVGPQSSRADIENKQKKLEESDGQGWQKLMVLYRSFLNNLDPQSLLSLLMSCLQSKFGLPMTGEAICEAIIVKAIEADPAGFKSAITSGNPALAAALGLNPSSALSDRVDKNLDTILGEDRSEGIPDPITGDIQFSETEGLKIDESYDGAPIATGMLFFGADKYSSNVVKNLEKGGTSIDLVPGVVRPPRYDTGGNLERYSLGDIQSERYRLKQSGYTRTEADALMVQSGFLAPEEKQFKSLDAAVLDPLEDLAGAFRGVGDSQAVLYGSSVDYDGLERFSQDAKAWVAWAKRVVDLGQICEAFLGPLFNLPRDLLRGEGFDTSYYENYWENLQKMFTFPTPKMDMMDHLKTHSFMSDYGNKLLDAFLSLIGTLLGQILNAVLRHYLQTCFQSDDEESEGSPLRSPVNSELIPELGNLAGLAGGTPGIGPAGVSPNEFMRWLLELIERLSSSQLCALLQTDASDSLLTRCVDFTRVHHIKLYQAGLDTGSQIQAMFTRISQDISLDICDTIQGAQVVAAKSLCYQSSYDSSARISELMEQGLSDDEARDQFKRELEDLRGTIKELAGLLFPNSNPLSNSIPDMCGPGGGFSLPAGIKDTMSRMTDNVLRHVEGSLITDLSTLKFFSLPSRALMAQADTGEMLNAHSLFQEVIGTPYKKGCFAYVGPQFTAGSAMSIVGSDKQHKIKYYALNYCLAYNEHVHYKAGLWTDGAGTKKQLIYTSMSPTVKTVKPEGCMPVLGSDDVSEMKPVLGAPTYPDLARAVIRGTPLYSGYGSNNSLRNPPDIEELGDTAPGATHQSYRPMLITNFLRETSGETKWFGGGFPLPDLSEVDGANSNSRAFFNKYKDNYLALEPYLEQYRRDSGAESVNLNNYNVRNAVKDLIHADYSKDVKPDYLDKLVYTTDMLFDSYDTRPDQNYSPIHSSQGIRTGQSFGLSASPGDPNTPWKWGAAVEPWIQDYLAIPQVQAQSEAARPRGRDIIGYSRKYIYKKSYPLRTKLVDINPSPVWWVGMFRLFTGADLHWETIYDPDKNNVWGTTDKDFVWRSSCPGIEFLSEESSYPGHGKTKLYQFMILGKEEEDGPEKYEIYIGNLMWAFMNLDLGTASGITSERVKAIYPNMKGLGEIDELLLTTTYVGLQLNTGTVFEFDPNYTNPQLVGLEDMQSAIADMFVIGDYDVYAAARERRVNLAARHSEIADYYTAMTTAEEVRDNAAIALAIAGGLAIITLGTASPAAVLAGKVLAAAQLAFTIATELYSTQSQSYADYEKNSFDEVYLTDEVFIHYTSGNPSDTVKNAVNNKQFQEYKHISDMLRQRFKEVDRMFEVMDSYIKYGEIYEEDGVADASGGAFDLEILDQYATSIQETLFEDKSYKYTHPALAGEDGPVLGGTSSGSDIYGDGTSFPPILTGKMTQHPSFVPLAITFKKQFKDPNEKFNDLDYFEMGGELVNKGFYDQLGKAEIFPQYMGFDEMGFAHYKNQTSNTWTLEHIQDPPSYKNFNPNMLRYSLPEENKKVLSYDQTDLTRQISDIYSELTTIDPDGQITALSDSITTLTWPRELIYQNSIIETPNLYPEVRDSYQFIKCKMDSDIYPPAMLTKNTLNQLISSPKYNFGFNKNFSKGVTNLLQSLYPGFGVTTPPVIDPENGEDTSDKVQSAPYQELVRSDFEKIWNDVYYDAEQDVVDIIPQKLDSEPDDRHFLARGASGAPEEFLNNHKALIFGKLLRTKFAEAYSEYSTRVGNKSNTAHSNNQAGTDFFKEDVAPLTVQSYVPPTATQLDKFLRNLQFNFTTYGYSSLQFAYSNQMFAKLRNSRINYRKWLRKLWDKILSTPQSRGEGSRVDPACQELFDQLAITSTKDMRATDTDFFNIALVKNHIMEYYEKAICKDVYEASPEGENAVKNSLMQGIILLIIKIYCLEMCLASVIAWDCFSLSDIFEDDILVKVVLQNISNDVENMNLLARHAKDIVKNRNELSYFDTWKRLTDSSALGYLIKSESESISAVVDEMFSQSNKISTKLTLQKLSNSDPDFVSRYRSKYETTDQGADYYTVAEGETGANIATRHGLSYEALQAFNSKNISNLSLGDVIRIPRKARSLLIEEAEVYKSFYTNYGYDIVVDAKLSNNPYTLNYGYSIKNQNVDFRDLNGFEEAKVNIDKFSDQDLFSSYQRADQNRQRDYFHSLPLRPIYKENLGDLSNNSVRPDSFYSSGQSTEATLYQSAIKDFLNQKYWKNFDSVNSESTRDIIFSNMFKGTSAYDKENIHEITVGNEVNTQLGNFIIQPFVKIVEQKDLNQFDFYEYIDPKTGIVCAPPGEKVEYNAAEHLPILTLFREGTMDPLPGTPGKGAPTPDPEPEDIWKTDHVFGSNPWNCHLYGYVPLSVWSDFYYNRFLKEVQNNEILTKFFDRYGLRPFFESIEIGFRLTYVGSSVVDTSPAIDFGNFMDQHMSRRGLHECKSLIANRMCSVSGLGATDIMIPNEIHIPITEVSRKLFFDQKGFRYDTDHNLGDPRPYEKLGFYSPLDKDAIVADWTVIGLEPFIKGMATEFQNAAGMNGYIKHTANNFSQLFYRELASDLLDELQGTAEFELIFDHLLPIKRYMSLAFLYCGDSLSKFISEPTKILQQTKSTLNMVLNGLANSDRFEYTPDPLGPGSHGAAAGSGDMGDTRGKDPSLESQILMILLKTPLLILKGFVEVTDPAIIIAKAIIDIANAIQVAVIGAIEAALKAVKQGIQTGIDEAKSSMIEIEINASSVGAVITATMDSLLPTWKTLPEGGWEEPGITEPTEDGVEPAFEIDTTAEDLKEWTFTVNNAAIPDAVREEQSYKDWLEQVDAAKDLVETYNEAMSAIEELEADLAAVEKDIQEKVTKAKEVLKDIFSSPFLLPSLWLALLPSMFPLGGGVIPPYATYWPVPVPLMIGPPSTVPGMIYLALLFIDAWEEKQHEQSKSALIGEDDVNCENEL